jgi:signal transduction histidine kinase
MQSGADTLMAVATAPAAAGEDLVVEGAPTLARTPWQRLWLGYSGWVLLNTVVLGLSLVIGLLSWFVRPTPEARIACCVLTGGLIAMGALWLWMVGPARGSTQATCKRYARFAGGGSLVLAVAVARLSPVGDVPAAIIAVPPLIAVAVHERLIYAIFLALFIATFTLLPARVFIRAGSATQVAAAFNAGGMALAGVVVVLVVSLLTSALRRETDRLRNSLAELRATRARLVEQETLAAVGRLAAGIAHEIRNPVAMIASSLEMASQESTPAQTRAEMSDIARQEAARLTTLTNDFLAYARGKPLERQDVMLEEVTGYVASLVRARAAQVDVSLSERATPGLRGSLDPFQLHHAMLNLTTNALDATARGGSVTIGAAPFDERFFDLFVENTAEALPPDVVARLFEPFFTTKSHGTGLGLPIARRIAKAHGGELLLARNEPGRVRFTLRLPRREPGTTESVQERHGQR